MRLFAGWAPLGCLTVPLLHPLLRGAYLMVARDLSLPEAAIRATTFNAPLVYLWALVLAGVVGLPVLALLLRDGPPSAARLPSSLAIVGAMWWAVQRSRRAIARAAAAVVGACATGALLAAAACSVGEPSFWDHVDSEARAQSGSSAFCRVRTPSDTVWSVAGPSVHEPLRTLVVRSVQEKLGLSGDSARRPHFGMVTTDGQFLHWSFFYRTFRDSSARLPAATRALTEECRSSSR